MSKKSQAALEFLATYAWAFVVIGTTISALYYFGVFDIDKYLPQKCLFPSQFRCLDFSLRPSEVRFKLVNNLGENICIKALSITNDANPPISCTPPSPATPAFCAPGEFDWVHSTDKEFVFTSCSSGAYIADERVELRVAMDYYAINTPSKPVHTISGKINGRVTSS